MRQGSRIEQRAAGLGTGILACHCLCSACIFANSWLVIVYSAAVQLAIAAFVQLADAHSSCLLLQPNFARMVRPFSNTAASACIAFPVLPAPLTCGYVFALDLIR